MPDDSRLVIRCSSSSREIPEWVWELARELEFLCVSDNRLTGVSPRIANLTKLRTLDIAHNAIDRFLKSLGDLPSLSDYLYLSDNRLTSFPEPVAKLANLRYLGLTDNRIGELPDSIGGLAGLVELRLYNNGLSRLPESIGSLARLPRASPLEQQRDEDSVVCGRVAATQDSRPA